MKALDEFLLLLTSHKVIRHEDEAVATDMDEELWRKISLRQHLFNRRIVALVFRRKVYAIHIGKELIVVDHYFLVEKHPSTRSVDI